MAVIDSVEIVSPFDDTPTPVVAFLTPSCLTKRADYTLETVVGADRVRSHGDDVILLLLNQGGGRRDNSKTRGCRSMPIGPSYA